MECGIVSQLTPPYTPQMNGVSEKRNRTLLDMVRSMMCRSTLPVSLWGHALKTAAHILNRVSTKLVEKNSYKIWTSKKPKLYFLKIWGCEVLEAIEWKSTKSCEKVGKKCKSDPERFRVREPYSFARRDVKFLEDSCFLADFTLEFRSLAPRSRLLHVNQPPLPLIPVTRSKVIKSKKKTPKSLP
ncbi:hypothetical protein OSB04_023670 [Centaurea solstitialis]|uniref:Integrase catalytic domain-containing protein n=1 Tax=Centaurea solstitialis TaxID=347529 RepID=A0AA38SS74_9ASTR|nr:hypothetical protein OSB04_023670 [Centaurea solstitialis]